MIMDVMYSISAANTEQLVKIHSALISSRMEMDKFFSMFLDKFERKMNSDNTDTPIWNLYKTRLEEYSIIAKNIRYAEYKLENN